MSVPFKRIQLTATTWTELREQFSRLQDEIGAALKRAESEQQASAGTPSVAPGSQALTFTNGPDALPATLPSHFLRLRAEDGTEVLVPGFRVR